MTTSQRHLLLPLTLGSFLSIFCSATLTVGLDRLADGLNVPLDRAGAALTVYYLAFGVGLLLQGSAGDRWGSRKTLLGGLVLFLAGSGWSASVSSFPLLLIGQMLQGLGTGAIPPNSLALITRRFSQTERGQAMGIWGSAAGLASIAGFLIGGTLVQEAGWRSLFWANIPVGLVALFFTAAWVKDGEAGKERRNPLRWLDLISHRSFSLPVAAAFLLMVIFTAGMVLEPLYFQWAWDLSPARAGWASTLLPLGMFVGTAAGGVAADRFGAKLMTLGSAVGLVAGCWYLAAWQDAGSFWLLGLGLAGLGFAFGLCVAPLPKLATSRAPVERLGRIAGVFAAGRFFGGGVGTAFASRLVVAGDAGSIAPLWTNLMVIAVLGAAVSLFLPLDQSHEEIVE